MQQAEQEAEQAKAAYDRALEEYQLAQSEIHQLADEKKKEIEVNSQVSLKETYEMRIADLVKSYEERIEDIKALCEVRIADVQKCCDIRVSDIRHNYEERIKEQREMYQSHTKN